MTLKLKSLLISLSTTIAFLLIVIAVVYQIITVQFQKLENQRVERNIRRITAILDDRFTQISSKLTDWTNWDDSYKFMQDKNEAYIISNLIPESFHNIGVDEALFIGKNGDLIASIDSVENENKENNFPKDLYSKFSTGSALLRMDEETNHSRGILKTNDGILLFAAREVLKSDQSGPAMGAIVFAKYLDKNVLNSVKELTQFEAIMYLWDDSNLTADFLPIKENYKHGIKELVRVLDDQTISGYLVIEDADGNPQAIVRSDIARDITLQGKSIIFILMWLLVGTGILMAAINFWLLTGAVLQKISRIASDVDILTKSGKAIERLKIGTSSDEVDKLRIEINDMIDSLQKSKTELSAEKQKGESLIDLVNAIVVTLDPQGTIITLNRSGLEILGYKAEDVLGKNWFEMCIPEATRKNINQHFKELISGNLGDNAHIENEVLTKDGKTLLVSWHNTLVKDQNGQIVYTLSLGEDVTLEKQEETKKENYAKELEKLNELMVNRELKMIDLKKKLDQLQKEK